MKENIYTFISKLLENGKSSYLATVINSEGSIPAEIGMKMVVYEGGKIFGTIGGGEIEKKVVDKIYSEMPSEICKWTFNLGTKKKKGSKTNMLCGGVQEILIEPLLYSSRLYIIGGGHCGIALSELACKVGFGVTVIDDRPEWANKEKHPDADIIRCIKYENVDEGIIFSDNTYIVIMTYEHKFDELVLKKLIGKKYKYLGMIGSKKKVGTIYANLKREGISEKKLKEVYSPVGLEIGSHTPYEIAVSIAAQLIAVKNRKSAR